MKSPSYVNQRRWSDRFIPHIRQLVGPHLLDVAPMVEDMLHNTDLSVLQMESKRIACRVRRAHYSNRYPWDVTLRTSAKGDLNTELAKVMQGWGDLMFYGFAADEEGDQVGRWVLGDMNALRLHIFHLASVGDLDLGGAHENHDGTTFVSIDWRNVDGFYIAGDPVPALTLI